VSSGSRTRTARVREVTGATGPAEPAHPSLHPGRLSGLTTLRWAALACLVLGGVGYADWALQFLLHDSLSPVTSFISELSATVVPHHTVFRIADATSGGLLMIGALLAWIIGRESRSEWSAWAAAAAVGLTNITEALTPMDCPLTATHAHCHQAAARPLWQAADSPHAWISALETLSFIAVLVLVSRALRGRQSPRLWSGTVALGVTALAFGTADALLTLPFAPESAVHYIGAVQRVDVTLTALWLAVALCTLLMVAPIGGTEHALTRRASGQTDCGEGVA